MKPTTRRNLLISAVAGIIIAAVGGAAAVTWAVNQGDGGGEVTFVGRDSCAACHQAEFEQWQGSHHDLAMDHATDATVLGDFDNAAFTLHGVTSTFFKRDGKFFVNTEGPDGKLHDYQVKYTFGVTPLQQYLIEFPGGRLQSLTIAWDDLKKQWYSLYPNEPIAHDDPLHWTNRLQNWNFMCAQCHSTNLQKNYDPVSDTYATTWAEIDVSCEACHGPGSKHVAWAKAGALGRLLGEETAGNYGLTTNLKHPDAAEQMNACFLCHARRETITDHYTHGEPWQDHFNVSLLQENLYHADGQILDEVYEFGSFTQSRMYHSRVRCSDCHNPHTLELRFPGNALCSRCHDPSRFDTPAHHFHQPGTAGSACVDCHMPTKTYMGIDVRRDHSLRLPRPDLTVKIGVPNACNHCHADQSPQWAADWVAKWHGPQRPQDPHYGEVIAPARQGRPEALKPLISLVADMELPAIVRATGTYLLRNYQQNPEAREAIAARLSDADPMVRQSAAGGLEAIEPAQRVALLTPLLDDEYRIVRIEVARALSSVPREMFTAEQREAFDAALKEYVAAQMVNSDMPGAWMNLAMLQQTLGNPQEAIENYRRAIQRDPSFVPARMNLATLYNMLGRNDGAERVLREVIALQPNYGEAYYSLGLLLAENPQRLAEAAAALGKAAELIPQQPRVHYNHGLAMQHLGQLEAAEQALLRAVQLDPRFSEALQALVANYVQRQMWPQAITYAEQLVLLHPGEPGAQQMLMDLRRRMQP